MRVQALVQALRAPNFKEFADKVGLGWVGCRVWAVWVGCAQLSLPVIAPLGRARAELATSAPVALTGLALTVACAGAGAGGGGAGAHVN